MDVKCAFGDEGVCNQKHRRNTRSAIKKSANQRTANGSTGVCAERIAPMFTKSASRNETIFYRKISLFLLLEKRKIKIFVFC